MIRLFSFFFLIYFFSLVTVNAQEAFIFNIGNNNVEEKTIFLNKSEDRYFFQIIDRVSSSTFEVSSKPLYEKTSSSYSFFVNGVDELKTIIYTFDKKYENGKNITFLYLNGRSESYPIIKKYKNIESAISTLEHNFQSYDISTLSNTLAECLAGSKIAGENILNLVDELKHSNEYIRQLKKLYNSKRIRETYEVISSDDGTEIFSYDQGVHLSGWETKINKSMKHSIKEKQRIYLTPENEPYNIVDSGEYSWYRFKNPQIFSSIFDKLILTPTDGVFTISLDLLDSKQDSTEFRYKLFYPENIEIISYEARCPSCKNENWEIWETLKGVLMFTCNETDKIALEIKYKIKQEKLKVEKEPSDYKAVLTKTERILNENIVNRETYQTNENVVKISVFDNASVDGDIISLYLNDEPLIRKLILDKCKVVFEVDLKKGTNIITLKAENLGTIPPNTATIQVSGKNINKSIVLKADMGYSESITIISN